MSNYFAQLKQQLEEIRKLEAKFEYEQRQAARKEKKKVAQQLKRVEREQKKIAKLQRDIIRQQKTAARKQLEAERAIRRQEREQRHEDDPRSWNDKRPDMRQALLPVNRKCPSCERTFVKSRQWVVISYGPIVVLCIACARKLKDDS